MSDIVERLRGWSEGQGSHRGIGMEAADEIERLREWQQQMVELAAGGGRLDGYRELAAKLAAKDEKVDRLSKQVAERDAEIERLRDQVVRLSTLVDTERGLRDAEVERLRKELEREKEEHDRCTTFHAIAVKERNYERVLALHRDTEIKRLRGLLAEAPCTCQNPPPYDWPHDPNNEECYLNRVRESAGGVR